MHAEIYGHLVYKECDVRIQNSDINKMMQNLLDELNSGVGRQWTDNGQDRLTEFTQFHNKEGEKISLQKLWENSQKINNRANICVTGVIEGQKLLEKIMVKDPQIRPKLNK